jgi:HEAT repeat protein
MHMQLYPRTDFMHLVPACPGVLVLGAWLLSRLAEMWQGGARNPWGGALTRAAVVAPLYLLAAIFVAPAVFRTWYLMRAWWERDTTAVVRLENGRAPLVIEPAAGATFRALSDTARYLREHATADEFVFTFPALDVISFLADRQNPTRHGYFYPGWPGHEVEAEVIDALRARPPRFIVALHGHALFFVTAPVYYFNLRDYVTDQYRLVERIGVFDVLGPNGADANDAKADDASASLADTLALWRAELQHDGRPMARRLEAALATLPAATPAALASALAQLDPAAQRLAALLVRKSRSAIGAAALATLLADRTLAPLVRALCLRVIGEVGELQSVVPLLAALKGAELNELGGLFGDLFTVTSRSWVEGYWFAPSDRYEFEEIGAHIQDRQLLQWIDDPWELGAVRAFAIRLAGRLGDRTMIPFLLRVVGDPNESIFLRTDAAHSLAELDYGAEALPAIGRLLQNDALVPAVLVARLYPKAPRAGRAVLLDAIRSRSDTVRATAYWIAAAVDDPTLIDALQRGLSDPFPEVQMAAAWGLGNLRAASSLAALAALADGANDQVARFAAQAMEKAKGP